MNRSPWEVVGEVALLISRFTPADFFRAAQISDDPLETALIALGVAARIEEELEEEKETEETEEEASEEEDEGQENRDEVVALVHQSRDPPTLKELVALVRSLVEDLQTEGSEEKGRGQVDEDGQDQDQEEQEQQLPLPPVPAPPPPPPSRQPPTNVLPAILDPEVARKARERDEFIRIQAVKERRDELVEAIVGMSRRYPSPEAVATIRLRWHPNPLPLGKGSTRKTAASKLVNDLIRASASVEAARSNLDALERSLAAAIQIDSALSRDL